MYVRLGQSQYKKSKTKQGVPRVNLHTSSSEISVHYSVYRMNTYIYMKEKAAFCRFSCNSWNCWTLAQSRISCKLQRASKARIKCLCPSNQSHSQIPQEKYSTVKTNPSTDLSVSWFSKSKLMVHQNHVSLLGAVEENFLISGINSKYQRHIFSGHLGEGLQRGGGMLNKDCSKFSVHWILMWN